MTVFAVIGLRDAAAQRLLLAVPKTYPEGSLRISPTSWLVVDRGTSREVSEKLGINTPQSGDAIVLAVSSYWGMAPTSIWEWIQSRWNR